MIFGNWRRGAGAISLPEVPGFRAATERDRERVGTQVGTKSIAGRVRFLRTTKAVFILFACALWSRGVGAVFLTFDVVPFSLVEFRHEWQFDF